MLHLRHTHGNMATIMMLLTLLVKMRDCNYMNTMKKSLVGLCAAFACASVATADTEAWDYVNTFPDAGTWALLAGRPLASDRASDDIWVKSYTEEDGTVVVGHWRSVTEGVGTLDVSDDGTEIILDTSTGSISVSSSTTLQQITDAEELRDNGIIAAVTTVDIDVAKALVTDAIKFKSTASEVISAKLEVSKAFSEMGISDTSSIDWGPIETEAEIESVVAMKVDDSNPLTDESVDVPVTDDYFDRVMVVDGINITDIDITDGDADVPFTQENKTAWLKAYYAKQAIANQAILDAGFKNDNVSTGFIEAARLVNGGVIEIVTLAEVETAGKVVTDGFDRTAVINGALDVVSELITQRNIVKDNLTGNYTLDDINNAIEVINSPDKHDDDEVNLAQMIVDVGVVGVAADADKFVTLGRINDAQGEIDKVVREGFTVDQIIEADALNKAGEIDTAVTQAEVDAAQAVINSSLVSVTTLDAILEAKAIVLGGPEGVPADQYAAAEALLSNFKDGVTQADIDAALATIFVGTVEGVTAEEIFAAEVFIAATQAIVAGATQEQIVMYQVLVNSGVSVENLTLEQIAEIQVMYDRYVAIYTAAAVEEVVGIYGLSSDEEVDTVLAFVNTYGSIEDINEAKAFVAAGGVDMVKALVNTGHIESALYSYNDKTLTMKDFVTKIQPDVSGAASGSTAGVNAVGGAIGGHQQSVVANSGRYGLKKHSLSVTKQLGVSSGDGTKSTGAWMKVFGSTSEMDMRDSIAGYDADASGIVVGVDKTFGDMIIGGAISVANIDIDGKSIANSKTDSDQYQGTLYGTLMMDTYYINGSLAYASASSDTSRIGLDGGVTGSYDTDTYAASLGIGVPIDMGSMAIVPQATMTYTSVNPDAYIESGIGALRVDAENMESFGIKAGVAVSSQIALDGGVVAPKLRLMADWDVTQEKAVVNSSWVGDVDNTVYSTFGAEPASLGAIIGAGVDYASSDGLYVLSLDYDLSTRADFVSHAGSVKVRVNF